MSTSHAEQRNTKSATEQMQPHLERTRQELADLAKRVQEHLTSTNRS